MDPTQCLHSLLFRKILTTLLQYIYMIKVSTFLLSLICWSSLTHILQGLGYGCDVQYCQYCSSANFCGICQNNFILSINTTSGTPYCQRVSCNVPHCEQCYQNGQCEVCQSGFGVTATGDCAVAQSTYIQCSDECLFCKNETYCQLCSYGYTSIDGVCKPEGGIQISHCVAYFSAYRCQLCAEGYAVNTAFQCSVMNETTSCDVSNCRICLVKNQCELCMPSFQQIGGSCTPLTCDVPNCFICQTSSGNTQQCSECESGYYLNTTLNKCVPKYMGCNVKNCLSCTNPQICSLCEPGYLFTPTIFDKQGTIISSMCSPILYESYYSDSTSDFIYAPVTHCKVLDFTTPGTSILEIGCLICEENYINAGGYCVANLSMNYQCNIPHCSYCISNNYCGRCEVGYVAYLGSNNVCVPYYSSHPNCMLTGLLIPTCAICKPGYVQDVLTKDLQCVKYWDYGTCSIPNCSYCVTKGKCAACNTGYTLNSNNTCSPKCSVQNCFRCLDSTTCSVCQQYYTLQNLGKNCTSQQSITPANCSAFSTDKTGCKACNSLQCTQCNPNYTLVGGSCCPTPPQDIYGCALYQSQCSNFCIMCQRGFNLVMLPGFNFGNQCLNLYCSIQNCAYCFQNTTCTLCLENYTLNSKGQCQNSPQCSENCASCSSNGTCTACESGYSLYYGSCVCPFQNCLKCMANSYCSVCAYPLTATGLDNPGCLPQVFISLQCNVTNCYLCYDNNVCSQCNNGYSLLPNGTCSKNNCTSKNCLLCNPQNTLCFLCGPGTYQKSLYNPVCETLSADYSGCYIDGCQFCESSTVCQQCAALFSLNKEDGKCYRYNCSDNCLLCFSEDTCNVCEYGYYRTQVDGGIECEAISDASDNCSSIKGCIRCQKNNTGSVQCLTCYPGLTPNSSNQCEPQSCLVPNCQLCNLYVDSLCLVCEQGYGLDPYFRCIQFNPILATPTCDVYNCLYCSSNNFCKECLLGWVAFNGSCMQEEFCEVSNCQYCTNQQTCVQCAQDYILMNNTCTPNCSIQNCLICSNMTTCQTCVGNLSVLTNGTSCGCPNNQQQITNTTNCGCPAKSTLYNNTCYVCDEIQNCAYCTADNVCGGCLQIFKLVNNACECPDSSFDIKNNSCVCPTGKKLFDNKTCVDCTVEQCEYCEKNNECSKCMGNLTLTEDNTCECPDTFYNNTDGYCICAPQQIAYNGTCYMCDIENCGYCTEDNICGECLNNLTLNSNDTACECDDGLTFYNNFCYTCNSSLVPFCNQCNATNFCYQCNSNFTNNNGSCVCASGYLLYQSSCISCSISNCKYCAQANTCSLCLPGYSLSSSGSNCIPCNIQNCSSCSAPNYCSSCQSGLVPNSNGNLCVLCSVGNCSVCSSDNTCDTCKQGFQFGLTNQNCYRCFVSGCKTCSQNNICSSCLEGYTLNSTAGTCSVCSRPCATCNGNNGCLTCQAPYSSQASSNGTCFSCSVSNCLTCQENNTSVCTQCALNYVLNSSNQCSYKCNDNNCLSCSSSSSCIICKPGYAFNSASVCVPCSGGLACAECSLYNPNQCIKCTSGFYSNQGSCTVCPKPYCDTCNANGCLTYKAGSNYFSITINGVTEPASCDFNCISCSHISPGVCLKCAEGYALVGQNCIACQGNCKTCSSTDLQTCYSCYSNANLYTNLKTNVCTACNSTCLTCSTENHNNCTSCPVGSYFNATQSKCYKGCPLNCEQCANQTYCTTCLSGYTTNAQGKCVPCLSNCRVCSSSSPALCLNCGEGFYLSGSTCKSCSSNCLECNQYGCKTCVTGYYVTSALTCTPVCNYPCTSCSPTKPNVCFSCLAGFAYNQTAQNCMPTTCTQNCQLCSPMQVLINGACVACQTHVTCLRCNTTNLTQCLTCFDGYFLNVNENMCQTCPTGCKSCSSQTNCLSCVSGYVSTIQSANSPVYCQACQFPCQTCFMNPQSCLTCATNYTLSGWQCITKFNLGFVVELQTTFTNFYANYYAFLQALALVFGTTNISDISMTSLKNGSVIASGNCSLTASSTQSNTTLNETYTNFTDLLSQGNSIAGMPIISSSVSVNGGTIPDTDDDTSSGPNLALILGICIPVGLILIGVAIYFICVCNKKSQPPVNYPAAENSAVQPPNSTVRQTFELSKSEYND